MTDWLKEAKALPAERHREALDELNTVWIPLMQEQHDTILEDIAVVSNCTQLDREKQEDWLQLLEKQQGRLRDKKRDLEAMEAAREWLRERVSE